jgi:hypothetical protein
MDAVHPNALPKINQTLEPLLNLKMHRPAPKSSKNQVSPERWLDRIQLFHNSFIQSSPQQHSEAIEWLMRNKSVANG